MVKLNNNTWITPTTYGSVFTHITQNQKLNRVYLDNEATHELCTNNDASILKQIESKNINVDGFYQHQKEVCEEINDCETVAKKNNWILFSLYPLQCSVQTLNYCNARCDFCYANAPQASDQKYMNLSLIQQLKDYAATYGVKFGVSGGEPLLHPNIYEILSYKNRDVFDTLITNLTAPVNLDKVIQTKVDLIQISIHGYKSIHDKTLHINGAYEKIFKRMKYLFPSINLATNTVITPQNINSIPSLVQDLNDFQNDFEKSLTYIRFVPVVPSGTGLNTYSVEHSFFDEVEELLRSLQTKYTDLQFEIPLIHANPYEYQYVNGHWMCPAGSTVAVVRLDGHLVPCNQFLDTAITSKETLYQTTFKQIWLHDSLFSSLRRGIAATKQKRCDECMYLIMKERNHLFDE